MWSVVVACALTCCGQGADASTPAPPEPIVADLSQGIQTGSLVFSSGDCLAVKIFSQSVFTHVGGVVMKDGNPIVYDSMNGVGVRKSPLAEYLRQQTPSAVYFVHPKTPFSPEKAAAFEKHLESQLGRKYAVKHHLTGQRCEGLHCSEYMTDALMAAEMFATNSPPSVSPGGLLSAVTSEKTYVPGNKAELVLPDTPMPIELTWYQRAWYSTASCCSKSSTQMRRWILCR